MGARWSAEISAHAVGDSAAFASSWRISGHLFTLQGLRMVDYWGCHDRQGLSWSCQSLMKPAISPVMGLGVGGCSGEGPSCAERFR